MSTSPYIEKWNVDLIKQHTNRRNFESTHGFKHFWIINKFEEKRNFSNEERYVQQAMNKWTPKNFAKYFLPFITKQNIIYLPENELNTNSKPNENKIPDWYSKTYALRILKWFLTNYIKVNHIKIQHHWGYTISAYSYYNTTHKMYKRDFFDVFARGKRHFIRYGDYIIITSIAQIVLMEWASHQITKMVINNYDLLKKAMKKNNLKNQKRVQQLKKRGLKVKRRELSPAPRNQIRIYKKPIFKDFNMSVLQLSEIK